MNCVVSELIIIVIILFYHNQVHCSVRMSQYYLRSLITVPGESKSNNHLN